MKKLLASLFVVSVIASVFFSCQKENSFEAGAGPSQGLLQGDGGDCLPKTVVGTYEEGTALNGNTNYIQVSVDVVATGTYTIYSDTANGVFFRATGIFTSVGVQTINLRGNGTPAADGPFNYTIKYEDQECTVQVDFLPSGAGGPAVFKLEGNICPGTAPTPAGAYGVGIPLNTSNTVTLSVDVTTIGTYTITSTPVQGMTFSKTGTFTTTGVQNVDLTGTGTPTGAAGPVTVNYTINAVACSFTVTLVGAAAYTYNCGSAVVDGIQTENVPLDASNTITIDLNVTAGGAYSITATIQGMTFASSGTLPATPATQQIVLTGTGTPSADGNFNLVLPGTPTCSVPITVAPGAAIDWKFTLDGTTTYQGSSDGPEMDAATAPPFTFFDYYGNNPPAATQDLQISLIDFTGGIVTNEEYNSNTAVSNAAGVYFDIAAGESYVADPTEPTVNVKVKVTSHVPATKTLSGTFSGTIKDSGGVTHTITNGTFTAIYP